MRDPSVQSSLGAGSGSDPEELFFHGIQGLPFQLFPLEELEAGNLLLALKWIRRHVAGSPLKCEHADIRRLA